jgi:hypothetical protein
VCAISPEFDITVRQHGSKWPAEPTSDFRIGTKYQPETDSYSLGEAMHMSGLNFGLFAPKFTVVENPF